MERHEESQPSVRTNLESNERSHYLSHLAIAESDRRILELLNDQDPTPENLALMQVIKDDLFYRESKMEEIKPGARHEQ